MDPTAIGAIAVAIIGPISAIIVASINRGKSGEKGSRGSMEPTFPGGFAEGGIRGWPRPDLLRVGSFAWGS
jgi:hypothetical protein